MGCFRFHSERPWFWDGSATRDAGARGQQGIFRRNGAIHSKKQKMEFLETDQYMAVHHGQERVPEDPIPPKLNLNRSLYEFRSTG